MVADRSLGMVMMMIVTVTVLSERRRGRRANRSSAPTAPDADKLGRQQPKAHRPDPDPVRARLQRILAEAKAAQALPWERVRLYRPIFPQMTLWLPEDEGAQLRFEFEAELARLEAA